mmetsp:Transcript_19748/g.27723  ORF Transcript_19748/g.27723 Transcript_19748/m.27723 type:complete len:211 (-) Transcript_19748:147-779(-)|eukprot:CAMPEP_0175096238 /NCGR_PEP_ID=MMETSP0086_2-20121207/4618_1 /TAXON_ID=136419 /ORGANISM="Unknown Unknown, Strain D1" /LENGTH=210 /DNA_ID=CAMNT_0016369611 /DNA_START=42 /DNA_END=674 /DNA_ORIENTATION=-
MKLLYIVGLFAATCSGLTDYIAISGNPHATPQCLPEEHAKGVGAQQSCLCPAQQLTVANLALDPVETQADTFLSLVHKPFMGVKVPVFQFKQPSRLSELQLPFKIVRMRHIDQDGLVQIPVPAQMAADSWFPGYSWAPVVCTSCKQVTHLGWKFTSKSGRDSFYGLIVSYGENNAGAAGIVDKIAEALQVGVHAPEWMTAFVAATIAFKS